MLELYSYTLEFLYTSFQGMKIYGRYGCFSFVDMKLKETYCFRVVGLTKFIVSKSQCSRNFHLQHLCQLFASERNGTCGNVGLKLQTVFFIEIPIWRRTWTSASAISEQKGNLQKKLRDVYRRKIIVPCNTADSMLLLKISFSVRKASFVVILT